MKLRRKIEGIYFCKDNKGNSEILNLSSTCYFSSNINEECTWKVEDDIVIISYYDGNGYDGYKKKKEYRATIRGDKLYIKDKICEK